MPPSAPSPRLAGAGDQHLFGPHRPAPDTRAAHRVTERSVSRAALRLGMHQPAVSTALECLRELSGDPLAGQERRHMVPTEAASGMLEPAANVLRAAETLFTEARSFDPRTSCQTFILPPATT